MALGREEHALVTDGRWEDLADLNARRERVLAALPASAPAEAMDDLREAARLQALSAAALRQGIAETGSRAAPPGHLPHGGRRLCRRHRCTRRRAAPTTTSADRARPVLDAMWTSTSSARPFGRKP